MTVFKFLYEWSDMNGFVSKCVQCVENGFELLPSFWIKNALAMYNLLKGVWKIFEQGSVHDKYVKEFLFGQTLRLCTGRIFQNVFNLVWMDVVEKIEKLILLEELDDTINTDESLIGAILVLKLMEKVEDHVFFIIFEVVAFLGFFLFIHS